MKKFSKLLIILSLSICGLTTIHTYASTGTTYTGNLLGYVQIEKAAIGTLFDTTYDTVYEAFAKTGLNILKSVEYQGLVCMGAIKDKGLLAQLQKDNTTFKVSFNRDFVELEKRVLGLEEKKRIQDENGLTMFDPGTTYETEKSKLKEEIDTKAQLHRSLISTFSSTYANKTTELSSIFQQYLAANQQLLQGIKNKMTKVQAILSSFAEVEATVTKINAKITGLDEVIKKMEDNKTKGLEVMNTMAQNMLTTNIKKHQQLQNAIDELTKQKTYMIGLLKMDLDEYLTSKLENRYNRTAYVALKSEVATFKSKYYSETNQLNCANFISATDIGSSLTAKIDAMKVTVNSGLVAAEKGGVTSAFKDQLYSGFQTLYIQKFKQRYAEYQSYIKNYITTKIRGLMQSTPTTPVVTGTMTQMPKAIFTRSFISGQYHADIKKLQEALGVLGFYTGAIDGIYTPTTKEAVYQFQLSKGLLKGYEKKPDVRGYFGPATRKAINNITK